MTNRVDLHITGEVASLHLEPHDSVVVTVTDERRVTPEFIDSLQHQLAELFPEHKVIVLQGLTISKQTEDDASTV